MMPGTDVMHAAVAADPPSPQLATQRVIPNPTIHGTLSILVQVYFFVFLLSGALACTTCVAFQGEHACEGAAELLLLLVAERHLKFSVGAWLGLAKAKQHTHTIENSGGHSKMSGHMQCVCSVQTYHKRAQSRTSWKIKCYNDKC
jgi:hypothetical protein